MESRLSPAAEALQQRLIRNYHQVPRAAFERAPLYQGVSARLSSGTAARKLGAGIDVLAPGKSTCPYHFHHAQEEMFIVLDGSGTLRVAGEMLPLRSGDIIFIPPGPEYAHQIINTSDAPLSYLSVSTQETPEICEYPDSGKYSASVGSGPERVFRAIQRSADSVDYWDGEP